MKSLILTVFLYSTCMSLMAQQSLTQNIVSGGRTRTYRVYLPALYNGQTPRPVVFNFHGSGGAASSFEGYTRFKQVADTANFILITPQGLVLQPGNYSGWNNFTGVVNGPDDVRFVSDMIDALVKQYNVDTTRIYSAGWSNGGLMGYHLAWQLGHRIAAVGSVCGSMQDSMYFKLRPSRPMPIIEIHGTNDALVPYNGGLNGGLYLMPVDSIMRYWVQYNGCDTTPTVTNLPNINALDLSTVKRYNWANGTNGTEVELLKITGGGHTWPNWTLNNGGTNRDITADVEMWRFFRRHTLDRVSSAPEQKVDWSTRFTLAPNPATDQIVLYPTDKPLKPAYIEIFDLSGKLVLRQDLSVQDGCCPIGIRVEGLKAGVYVLKVVEVDGVVGVGRVLVGER